MDTPRIIDDERKKALAEWFGSRLKWSEPMSRHTSFRVGGPAEAFFLPETEAELARMVQFCNENSIPVLVTGGGTNLLVRDGGIPGVVIQLKKMKTPFHCTQVSDTITEIGVPAGMRLSGVCGFALKKGLFGMQFALGIPGSVGGAVRMNAGTKHGAMESVLLGVWIMHKDGRKERIERNAMVFGYRKTKIRIDKGQTSSVSSGFPLILSAVLRLWKTMPGSGARLPYPENRGNARQAGHQLDINTWQKSRRGPDITISEKNRIQNIYRKVVLERKKNQPCSFPSAGCFFKNPSPDQPAGALIDRAGMKGARCGAAQVSCAHANFIINTGSAKASEILTLMKEVQNAVYERFGISLTPEVEIVGI